MWKLPANTLVKVSRNVNIIASQHCRSITTLDSIETIQPEQKFQTAWDAAKPFNSIPGPNIYQFVARSFKGGRYHKLQLTDIFKLLIDEYGPITKIPGIGNPGFLLIADPKDFETVYRNEGTWPRRRGIDTLEYYRNELRPGAYQHYYGLPTSYGEEWGKIRSIANPVVAKPSNVNSYIPMMDEIAMDFIHQIKASRDHKNEVPADFFEDLKAWSLESITYIALNQRLNLVGVDKTTDPVALELIEAMGVFFKLSFELDMKPSIWKFVATPKFKRLMKTLDKIQKNTMYLTEKAIEQLEKNPTKKRGESMFEQFLEIDKNLAIILALDMLGAGIDTTSSSTAHFLYHLSKNQDKQAKLRQEVQSIPMDENGKLTTKSFLRMPYLRACLKESNRLSPIIPGNSRAIQHDIVLRGYQIPKDTFFTMANKVLYEDEKIFKEPKKFIPERWLSEKEIDSCPELGPSDPFVLMPFGFGPRTCIGKRIAEMEMKTLTTRLLREFKIEFDYGPLVNRTALILTPVNELKYKFTEL